MRAFSRALTFVGMGFVLVLLHALPAQAQATRTWVSGVGDDANPCSRTAPCKTFAGAISKTAANGEINAIDAGAFGTVTITKSITINTEGLESGVLGTGTNGITVNAGANDVVVLRGLDIDGSQGAGASPGLNGIRFLAGGALHVQKCLIRNFKGASPNGFGILFTPNSASKLFVSDTIISNNGAAATGGGIIIKPSAGGSAKVALDRVRLDGNTSGFNIDNSAGTGSNSYIRDSTITGNNQTGISFLFTAGGGGGSLFVDGTGLFSNGGLGITANGNAATMFVSNSTITQNNGGISTVNGAQIFSFQTNNLINNSGNDGAFTPPVQAQQ